MHLSTRRLFIILIFLGIVLLALMPVNDPDFWWHLRTGQWIVDTGQIPKTDPFSYTMQGQPWVAHEWLSDVFIYSVYRIGSLPLLMLVFALIITAAFLTVLLRCSRTISPYITGFCVLLGAIASRPLWGVRPQMITLLFFGITLVLLDRHQKDHKLGWLVPLPLMMLAWVNLHGAFILGLALMGVFLVGEVIDWMWKRFYLKQVESADAKPMLALAILLIASLGASLVNPNGIKILLYPFQTLTDPSMQKFIVEWYPPNFTQLMWVPLAILILGLVGTSLFARRGLSVTQILLNLIFLFAALSSSRHVPLFAMVAVPTLTVQLSVLLPIKSKEQPARKILGYMNWIILFALAIVVGWQFFQQASKQNETTASNYPVSAVEWIQKHHPEGRMFNSYNWGGYLIWKLYPQYQVFIDGRADVYGPDFFARYADIYLAQAGWQGAFSEQKIDFVLVDPGSPLAQALGRDSTWKPTYQDDLSVIFEPNRQ